MKNFLAFVVALVLILGTIVYIKIPDYQDINSVGFIFPDSIHDQTWGTEGYKAMLDIVQKYDTNFYIQENINTESETRRVLEQFINRDVSIIYGQGSEYEHLFNEYAKNYPKTHFVFTNGVSKYKNVTALNIEAYSLGFFAGYFASHESKTKQIGIIGAFDDQPEIQGFKDGAHYENKQTVVQAAFVETWSYSSLAAPLAKKMIQNEVDIIYPAADGINSEVMQTVKDYNKKAIGYISDQSYLGDFVLVSTMQDISTLYQEVALSYSEGRLVGGTQKYSMKDKIAKLSDFSPLVSNKTVEHMNELIDEYLKTGKLPNGKKPPQTNLEVYLKDDM